MRMTGSIRWTEQKIGPHVVTRKSPPWFAFQDGTVLPGPGAHISGPGSFFAVGLPRVFCTVSNSVPIPRSFVSYFIPLERRSRLGARSTFHERSSNHF